MLVWVVMLLVINVELCVLMKGLVGELDIVMLMVKFGIVVCLMVV